MSSPTPSSEPAHGTAEVHEKATADVGISNLDAENSTEDLVAANGELSHSTRADIRHMRRMGKDQQLIRNFRLTSIVSFVAIGTAAWELALFLITPGLTDGGIPSLMWSMIWNMIGFFPVYASMAEMASMCPISGAQYHWVSEFAPEKYQRFLSYITGWTSTLAWQGGNALGVFLVGTLVQSIISINLPDYTSPSWQGTLLVIGSMLIALAGNVFGARVLHMWQNPVFIVHIVMWFVLIIPIWVRVPRISHEEVWMNFQDFGGWPNMVISVLAGQLSSISNQVGVDTAAHMSEEVKDGGRQVPKAMLMVYAINFVVSFPTLLTLVYHMPSVEDALNDPSSYPAIYVLNQCWSTAGVTGILVVTTVILIFSNIAYLAAVTRDLFAFSRDRGLPFSAWLSTVDKKRAIPVNAAFFSSATCIALSLIYIGSPVAFYAITSLTTVALLQCYCLSIGCILWRRIYHPETLPPASFSLGRWGIPLNIAAVTYSLWCFFWTFWPQYTPVTVEDFNWASMIFGATLIVAMIYFVFRGRHNYHGPVTLVEGRKVQ